MFCQNCGKPMQDGENFCASCGTPIEQNNQGAAPPFQQQVTQNTIPMPPQPPQPSPWQQQGWNNTAHRPAEKKMLFYGLGIAAAVLLLAGGGFAAYHYGLFGKTQPSSSAGHKADTGLHEKGVMTSQTIIDGATGQSQNPPTASDPIRANLSAGRMAVTSQMDEKYLNQALQRMQGDWYDDSGAKAVTINGRQINGCEVIAAYDFAGGGGRAAGTFRLREKGQEWDVRISWNISGTRADSITVNGNQTLHKTQEYYYETIAGLHLGMTAEQVTQKIGQPSRALEKDNPVRAGGDTFTDGWYYQDKGIIVGFGSGSVDRIILLKQSHLGLDKSGLNCSDSPDAFAKAYSMSRKPKWPSNDYQPPYPIGNGEFILFGKNMEYIMLTIYDT